MNADYPESNVQELTLIIRIIQMPKELLQKSKRLPQYNKLESITNCHSNHQQKISELLNTWRNQVIQTHDMITS